MNFLVLLNFVVSFCYRFVDFEFVFKTLAWHLNFELFDGFIELFWTFIAFESGILLGCDNCF